MEDKEDIISDRQNGDSKDITMTDEGVQNEELTKFNEAHNVNNDFSYYNGEEIQNEVQSHVETVDTCRKDDSKKPSFNAREEGPLEPSVITSDVNEIHVGLPVESPCVEHSEMFLETQNEGETKSNLDENELDRETWKKEEELNNERSGETKNGEVNLTLERERKEENMISCSNGSEFHQDDKSNDRNIEGDNGVMEEVSRTVMVKAEIHENELKKELNGDELEEGDTTEFKSVNSSFLLGLDATEDDETGTPEDQLAFHKELENFHKERFLDFKPPRFYQEPLNLLKLWRATVRLGGYEQVTSCKLWRQIGESFKPPKTCTTVSWTFRSFYEKALLEYEKHKLRCGELPYTESSIPEHIGAGTPLLAVGSGRQRRDAASRAMQGWHSRLLGNGDVGDSTLKDKIPPSSPRREKPLKSIGLLKRKMPSPVERAVKVLHMKTSDPQSEADVIDIGHPADWVKVNVQRTKDCFEVYALIPGLLREEVRVQSDAVGRLVISGQPDQLENPWGVTPFRKVVSLPSRIDPHQTSAVVTLHGQLFVRVPFDPLDI